MSDEEEVLPLDSTPEKSSMSDSELVEYVLACRKESEESSVDRIKLTEDNYDQYHLKHDFTHKAEGQSKEVISKLKMAVESTKATFMQALMKATDWWKAEPADGSDGMNLLVRPDEIYKMTNYKMKQADYYGHVGDCVQGALLGSLAISKVDGCMKPKPRFVARTKGRGKSFKRWVERIDSKTWHLKFDLIRHKNYFPDPQNTDLYEVEDIYLDLHTVKRLAKAPYELYDADAVKGLKAWPDNDMNSEDRARETGQNVASINSRQQVKLTEFWGTVVNKDGEIEHENVVITIANDKDLIRRPTPNPNWHQKTPIIRAALLEVGNSVWGTALMDAGTKLNRVQTEVYNLMLDAAMKAVHAVSQIRIDDLDDQKQIANGIKPGTNLKVRSSLTPGAKVMEPLTTANIPTEVFNLYNITAQEGNASMLSTDLRSGMTSARAVKATEVVEQSNAINSVMEGLAQNVELKLVQKQLELAWMTTAQNWDLIDKEEFISLFGKERGEQLSQLAPEEVFASTVSGIRFHVYGISLMLQKSADFRKYTTLLQTIGASEALIEAFLQGGGDFGKLLKEIMRSLDIDINKVMEVPKPQVASAAPQAPAQAPPNPLEQPGAAPGAAPQDMSQVPQAGAGGLADVFAQAQQAAQGGGRQPFPGSRATANRGGG